MVHHLEIIADHLFRHHHHLVYLMFILQVQHQVAIVLSHLLRQIFHHLHLNGLIELNFVFLLPFIKQICLISFFSSYLTEQNNNNNLISNTRVYWKRIFRFFRFSPLVSLFSSFSLESIIVCEFRIVSFFLPSSIQT